MRLVIACDPRGGIGLNNSLPWKSLHGDLSRFKKLTHEGVVIMGKNTWDSLPVKPLPGRVNFVVTRADSIEGATAIKDLSLLELYPLAWLIGGASLVDSNWQYIDEVHLTRTHSQYDCDTFIDLVYLENNYTRVHIEHYADHDYEIWERLNAAVPRPT